MYSCIIISVQHVNKAIERILLSVFIQAYFIVSGIQKSFLFQNWKNITFFFLFLGLGTVWVMVHWSSGTLFLQHHKLFLLEKRQRRCCLFPIGLCTSGTANYSLFSLGPGPRHAKEQLKGRSSKQNKTEQIFYVIYHGLYYSVGQ